MRFRRVGEHAEIVHAVPVEKMAAALDKLDNALDLNAPAAYHHGTTVNDHTQATQNKATPSPPTSEDSVDELEARPARSSYASGPETSRGPYGLSRVESGVDVDRAEEEFAQLSKQLSARSKPMSRQQSRASGVKGQDIEKAVSATDTSDEHWDLEETLRGVNEANEAAGIKSKHIG